MTSSATPVGAQGNRAQFIQAADGGAFVWLVVSWPAVGQRARAEGRGCRVEGDGPGSARMLRGPEVNVLRRLVKRDRDRVAA